MNKLLLFGTIIFITYNGYTINYVNLQGVLHDTDSIKVDKKWNNIYLITETTKTNYTLESNLDNLGAQEIYMLNTQNAFTQNKCCNSWTERCEKFLLVKNKELNNTPGYKSTLTKNICNYIPGNKFYNILTTNGLIYMNNNLYGVFDFDVMFANSYIYSSQNNLIYSFETTKTSFKKPNPNIKSDTKLYINLTQIYNKCLDGKPTGQDCNKNIEFINYYNKYIKPKIEFMNVK